MEFLTPVITRAMGVFDESDDFYVKTCQNTSTVWISAADVTKCMDEETVLLFWNVWWRIRLAAVYSSHPTVCERSNNKERFSWKGYVHS